LNTIHFRCINIISKPIAYQKKVGFIVPVLVYPGEDELEALARNALRVARHETEAKKYNPKFFQP